MREEGNEERVHGLREHEHRDGDLHRRAHVLAGVEAGREDLHADQAQQADAVAHQRVDRLLHIARRHRAVVVQHRDQRLRKHQQCHRARQRQQQHEAQAPVEQAGIGSGVVARLGRRELGQQHGAQCDPEQGGRELHQPVGPGEPRHRADADMGGDLGVDHERQLRHRHADQRRHHLHQHPVHARVTPGRRDGSRPEADVRQAADARQRRHLDRELQHAAGHHAHRQRIGRLEPPGTKPRHQAPGGADDGQVQQHRCRRRHGETFPGVQDAGRQRDQRHAGDVGEHPARHDHRAVELLQP